MNLKLNLKKWLPASFGIFVMVLIFVEKIITFPIHVPAKGRTELSEALEAAGNIRNRYYEGQINHLGNRSNSNDVVDLKLTGINDFKLKSGMIISWNIKPREGVLVETNLPVEGYFVYIDLDGRIKTRAIKSAESLK